MSSYTKNISNTYITPRKSHIQYRYQAQRQGKTPPTIAPRSNSPYINQSHYNIKLLPKCQGSCSFSVSYLKQIACLEQYIETLLKIQLEKQDTIRILQRRLCQQRSMIHTQRQQQPTLKESQTILIHQLNEKTKKILSQNSRLKQQLAEYKQYSEKLLIDHREEKRKWEIQMSGLINEANLLKKELHAYCIQLSNKNQKSQIKSKYNSTSYETGIQCSISQLAPSRLKQIQSIYIHKINELISQQERKWLSVNQRIFQGQRKIDQIQVFQHQLQFEKNVRIQKTVQQSKINLSKTRALRGDDNNQINYQDQDIDQFIEIQSKNKQKIISQPTIINRSAVRPLEVKPVYTVIQRRPLPVNFVHSNSSFGPKTLTNVNRQMIVQRPRVKNYENSCSQEISRLHQIINSKQQIINQKEQIINSLQSDLNRLSQEPIKKIERVQIPQDFYMQLETIRRHLMSCNPSNYRKFFEDMEQIIRQRNEMKTQIIKLQQIASESYRFNHDQTERDLLFEKSANQTLRKKNSINQEEIKKLNLKIAELEQCIQKIKNAQFSKANTVSNEQVKEGPKGYDALEWQKAVRSCIDDTLLRLEALQLRAKKGQNRQVSQVIYVQRSNRARSKLVKQSQK